MTVTLALVLGATGALTQRGMAAVQCTREYWPTNARQASTLGFDFVNQRTWFLQIIEPCPTLYRLQVRTQAHAFEKRRTNIAIRSMIKLYREHSLSGCTSLRQRPYRCLTRPAHVTGGQACLAGRPGTPGRAAAMCSETASR